MAFDRRTWIIVWLTATLFAASFSAAYVHFEHPAYLWDYATYFDKYQLFGSLFGTRHWFHWMGVEISSADYNPSLLTPTMPFYALFGPSRTAYVIALAVCWLTPAALLLAYVTARTTAPDASKTTLGLIIAAAFLYPPLWASALRGMPDVGAMIPLTLATYLVWRSDFLASRPLVNGLVIGLLLWSAFLFRRWVAFSVVGSLLAAGVFVALRIIKQRDWRLGINPLLAACICATLILLCVTVFQFGLEQRILATSFTDNLASYRSDPLRQITTVLNRMSWIVLMMTAFGLLLAIYRRQGFVLFCALAAAITFVIFSRVQDTGPHHSMPFFVWLFPAYALAIAWLMERAPKVAVPALALIIGWNFIGTFAPPTRVAYARAILYPREPSVPLNLGNFAEYQRLTGDLKTLMADGKKFAVFAADAYLADQLLIRIEPTLRPDYMPVAAMDSVQPFMTEPFSADYVIVSDPAAVHRTPGAMQSISVPNDFILQGQGVGAAFSRQSGPYALRGVKAYIYKRDRAVTPGEFKQLYDVFRKSYPKWSSPLEG